VDEVLMGELSGTVTHRVGSDQVWAVSLGWSPRALCGHVFPPAALAAPLPPPCPACAALATRPPAARRARRLAASLRLTAAPRLPALRLPDFRRKP
jgi:hypothetical protein